MVITVWSLRMLIQDEMQQQFGGTFSLAWHKDRLMVPKWFADIVMVFLILYGEAITVLLCCTTSTVLLLLELLKLKENWQCAICLEPTHIVVTIDCFSDGCFIAILCCVVLREGDYMSSDINVPVLLRVLLLASELIQEQKLRNHNGCSSNTNLINDVSVGIAATLGFSPVLALLPHWLCFHFLWKSPWLLHALVASIDDGLDDVVVDDADDLEHEAEAVIPAEQTVKNAAAQVTADVQLLSQCCPSAMAGVLLNLSCGSWSENLVGTRIIQVPIVRCSGSLLALHLATTNLLSNYYTFKLDARWLDSVQLIFCDSQYTARGLFCSKVIWLLPAFVLSTYFVQPKRGGLTQFDSFLLSSIWPVKRSSTCLVPIMPIQWPFFCCYGADAKQCTLLLFQGSNHGFNSIPKIVEGSTCLLLWFSDEPNGVYNISGLGASRLSRRGECQLYGPVLPWAEHISLQAPEAEYKGWNPSTGRGIEDIETHLPLLVITVPLPHLNFLPNLLSPRRAPSSSFLLPPICTLCY